MEWRIHFSTALVQKALLSLRNANRQMCSITNACYFDALKYLSTLYGTFRQRRFLCKLLSSWYYQCHLACMLLPDGPVGSELCQLEKARAVSFRGWRARVAWTCFVSTLPLVIFKWIAAASPCLVVRRARVDRMPLAPVLICHAKAIVKLSQFADHAFSQLLRPLEPSVLEALWSHDVFARVILPHVSWLFAAPQSEAELCALSPSGFRESALGVQSLAVGQYESRFLLNDMRCQALDQLAGSLGCVYRNVPLVSKLAGAAVISCVNRVTRP